MDKNKTKKVYSPNLMVIIPVVIISALVIATVAVNITA